MALNSLAYLILFPIIIILYYSLPGKFRIVFLTIISLAFYSLWDVRYTCILLLMSLVTWISGRWISEKRDNQTLCKVIIWLNIAVIAGFLLSIRFLPKGSIIVPIGISFYSLQAIGYVSDVYLHRSPSEKSLTNYIFFNSFFATVTSGPIQRTGCFLKQIGEKKEFDYDRIRRGLYMIAYGLFAKNFVADRLEFIVYKAYAGYDSEPGFILLIGVVAYAFQLYCDFMGYSYIALGSALALGFELPDNFRQPYFSTSVKEFWGRWHISLSEWLRDYLYYSLGGSRKGRARTVLNIAIVFVLSGIWHGRGLTFIIWGALHALYRIFEVFTLKKREAFLGRFSETFPVRALKLLFGFITFVLVDFAWLFFRAESASQAIVMVKRIFTESSFMYSLRNGLYTFGRSRKELFFWLSGLIIVFLVDVLHEKNISVVESLGKKSPVLRWSLYFLFIAFMMGTGIYYYGYSASTFIYSGF